MVVPMLAWVTLGSMAPGVRDGLGSTPDGAAAVVGAAVVGAAVAAGATVGGTVAGADDAVVLAGCCALLVFDDWQAPLPRTTTTTSDPANHERRMLPILSGGSSTGRSTREKHDRSGPSFVVSTEIAPRKASPGVPRTDRRSGLV